MRPSRLAMSLALCLAVGGCGDDSQSDSPADDAAPTAPTSGLCTVITSTDIAALFEGDVVIDANDVDSTEDRCSLGIRKYGAEALGSILLSGSGIPILAARDNAIGLGQPVTDIEGLAGTAFFASDEDQHWVAVGVGDVTYTTSVRYRDDVQPPENLQGALTALAERHLAAL